MRRIDNVLMCGWADVRMIFLHLQICKCRIR